MAKVTSFLSYALRRRRLPREAVGGLLFLMASGAVLSMTGCASPVTLYHEAEGGDIATVRQPPPGADLPYPNLAAVPAAPAALSVSQTQAVQQQLQAARAAPTQPDGAPAPASPQALAGLTLPGSAPELPDVPGINLQGLRVASVPMAAVSVAPAPVARPDGAPVVLAFQPQSALLSGQAQTALTALAQARGSASILVVGFGEQGSGADAAALALAVHRARRIADALTAAGVPSAAITLTAAAAGSGGFAQLVY